jgi:3D (Asp-Asp-Asp) domain-containing protein
LIGNDHRQATFVATSVLGLSLVLMSATSASATTRNNGLFSSASHAAATPAPARGVTVTIVQDGDGASFVTRAKTVADFLAERQVIPGASDYVSPALDTPLSEGMQIEYRKAVPVSLMFGRQRRDVVTSATTVGALLADQGVTLGPNDHVQPAATDSLEAGSVVRIVRTSTWTIHQSRRIPAGVVHRNDPTLPPGTTKTIAGAPGMLETTTRFVQQDDDELAQRIIGVRIVRQPRAKLVLRGIGEYAAFASMAERGFDATLRLAGNALRMVATAYTAGCGGCSGITASGRVAGHGVVAVDPRIIPLGSRLFIPGYGSAVAGDTGSAIRGNRIDLGFNSLRDALLFGRRAITVYVLH